MLNKNIYLIYPAGYSGSYVSWCLSKSEESLKDSTVNNPINTSQTEKYGGLGTSHLHHRYPTHCGIDQLVFWLILNQPKDKKIYLINGWDNYWLIKSVYNIIGFDRDPVIIQISAEDKHYNQLGHINAITKWPLYFEIQEIFKVHNIDVYNLDNTSLHHRNVFVKYYNDIFTMPNKLDFNKAEGMPNMPYHVSGYRQWYNLRNKNNPHEVNEEQFAKPSNPVDYYHHLDLSEIYKETFIDKLSSIVKDKNAGDFDFEYAKSFHNNYIEAQQHLRFIDEINEFKKTKVLTAYLDSHPLIQAIVIKEIFDQLPTDWETKTLQEIVKAL